MTNTNNQQFNLAVLGILFSSAMWGLIWYPMRLLEQQGLPVVWSTLLMYFAAAIVATAMLFKQKKDFSGYWPPSLWALAAAAGVTNIAFLVALTHGEVMRVMLLFYLSPLWSVLLSRWWLGEKISRVSMLMIIVAMSGTMIMLWHPEIGLPWPNDMADWLALFAGFMFSVNNVLSRKLADVAMEVKTTIVYWGVVMVAGLVLVLQQSSVPDISLNLWLAVMVFGGLCFTAMTIAVLYGLARMPVFRSAILMLSELVVAAISAWWLTSEQMSQTEWLGGALIFIAAYGMAKQGKA
ncbi:MULTISPECIES: DMT family transporter [unclassified Methylophaga]|jgi:drug/metabolite transporter (DMT)-like permease|uniref:DMT family transporter n=1 Tax=unclassified Methylophaga TaxID=2629249 RepID=UPI00259CE5A4|nr:MULTISPECIES: DMT family transporter [unclassified Methylophaga]|tara:strand:- start:2297 stop:3178 length:882 start_codon:yes stop_codon:yes gene_type:complete